MCKRLTCLTSFLVMLILTCNASADLIDHWKFDEGSGNTAINSIAGGTDGTIDGATWTNDPPHGVVLSFDGVDDVVTMVDYKGITGGASRSICLWFKTDGVGTGPNGRGLFGWGTPQGSGVRWELAINMQGDPRVPGALRINASSGTRTCQTIVTDSQWHHVAVTLHDDGSPTSEEMYVYLDGVEESYSQTNAGIAINTGSDADVRVGNGVREDQNGFFAGLIDDVRIYDHALTETEILAAMAGATGGYLFALSPNPADGVLIEDTWANLSWSPGNFAVSHDIYISDDFNAVNEGAEGTFIGNQTDTFIVVGFPGMPLPDGLVPGTTYYWRIDEVNEAEPNSPWKGSVWSFSIPPKTAYFPDPADGAEGVSVDPQLSWTGGYGSKLHTVYFGETFDEVDRATDGSAQGGTEFSPGTLKMAKTYYWRVDEFDIVETHKGDVWSFTTEGAVAALDPVNGAVDVTQTPVLTWAPGLGATYDIYFGTDASALEKKASGNLGEESYDAGQLELDTTYYWRVDEANSANADSPWIGLTWSFTTANFLIIDDMEAYNDIEEGMEGSNRIYNAWVDGYDDPTNGSQSGHLDVPFYEETIVHGGNKSLPLYYDNAVGKSEATLTLTDKRDWTVNGVDTLTIWFRGASGNAAEQMYVTLNGTVRVDNDNPDAATTTSWTEWNIELQKFADQGVNLTNVNSITLGLSSVTGGTGIMYFDDIRLCAP